MKVLIDECVPWKFGRYLSGHHCEGVAKAGFSGQKNGVLLASAEQAGFEVILTVDQGIPYQLRPGSFKISVVIIESPSNKIEALLPYVAACLEALRSIRTSEVLRVNEV